MTMNFIQARKAKINGAHDAPSLLSVAGSVMDGGFSESDHPRANNGQFGQGTGGGEKSSHVMVIHNDDGTRTVAHFSSKKAAQEAGAKARKEGKQAFTHPTEAARKFKLIREDE